MRWRCSKRRGRSRQPSSAAGAPVAPAMPSLIHVATPTLFRRGGASDGAQQPVPRPTRASGSSHGERLKTSNGAEEPLGQKWGAVDDGGRLWSSSGTAAQFSQQVWIHACMFTIEMFWSSLPPAPSAHYDKAHRRHSPPSLEVKCHTVMVWQQCYLTQEFLKKTKSYFFN